MIIIVNVFENGVSEIDNLFHVTNGNDGTEQDTVYDRLFSLQPSFNQFLGPATNVLCHKATLLTVYIASYAPVAFNHRPF